MRSQWIVASLCSLITMGLLVIIVGQRHVLIMLDKGKEKLPMEIKKLDDQVSELKPLEFSVQKLLTQGGNLMKDLEGAVAKLTPEVEKKRADVAICQTERERNAVELAARERERSETEASVKSESDAWQKEIQNLRAQLVGYRPICDHVKNGTLAKKLCGTKKEDSNPARR